MKSNNRITVIILGLLAQEPLSGYGLKKRMEVSVANFVSPSFGNIYPTLKKLDNDKLIEQIASLGGHEKKVFKTTPNGIEVLISWLKSPVSESEPFLLREYFFDFIDRKERKRLVQEYIEILHTIIKRYQSIETTYKDVMGIFPYQTLRYGFSQARHDLAWYENLLKEL